jgi:hypothetical protein
MAASRQYRTWLVQSRQGVYGELTPLVASCLIPMHSRFTQQPAFSKFALESALADHKREDWRSTSNTGNAERAGAEI